MPFFLWDVVDGAGLDELPADRLLAGLVDLGVRGHVSALSCVTGWDGVNCLCRRGVGVSAVACQDREQFVADVRRRDAGDLGVVVGRRDLDDVGADDVQADEAAQGVEQFPAGQAAGFRGAGTRGVGGVEDVDVDGDIDRRVAQSGAHPVDNRGDAVALVVVGTDDLEAE